MERGNCSSLLFFGLDLSLFAANKFVHWSNNTVTCRMRDLPADLWHFLEADQIETIGFIEKYTIPSFYFTSVTSNVAK